LKTPRLKIKRPVRTARNRRSSKNKKKTLTSDDVIYLDAGHIVEHGSFDELMAAKGTFYQQVNARGDE